MSDNVNKDIQNAIQGVQGNGNTTIGNGSVKIPNPRILKHSLDLDGVNFSDSSKYQGGKKKK